MNDLALSIRQPWAWLIIYAGKDIENRTWPTRVRGRVLIHASKGMTQFEYADACCFVGQLEGSKIIIPAFEDLQRGGIVGWMNIVDCVSHSKSRWYFGPYGFVIDAAGELPFRPCKGSLGFFKAP